MRIALVAALAGCSFAVPATNGTDAAGSGEGNAAVCDPSAADTCKDPQTLTACRADGTGFDDRACSLGCIATPAAHCVGIVPSNGIPVATLTDGDADLDTTGVGVLDVNTDTGAIAGVRAAGPGYDGASHIYFATVVQASAPTIGVFAFGSLHVAAGTTVRAHGGNALALVAEGTIEIDGIVDVTGGATACTSGVTDLAQCAGPGGMTGGGPQASASGAGAGTFGTGGPSGYAESGGGGGGHGVQGASGGAGTTYNTTVGGGGPAFGTATLTPLVGGGGGGGGGNEPQCSNAPGGTGGGGGGAVQIVSATSIAIGPSTTCGINAGGGGAGGANCSSAGGGGGAGGGILLEAPAVALGAGCALAANGGGGSGAHMSQRGTTGLLGTTAAAGSIEGSGGTRSSGNGGAGGTAIAPIKGADGNDEAGGGGGAAGLLHVNTTNDLAWTTLGQSSPAITHAAISVQ